MSLRTPAHIHGCPLISISRGMHKEYPLISINIHGECQWTFTDLHRQLQTFMMDRRLCRPDNVHGHAHECLLMSVANAHVYLWTPTDIHDGYPWISRVNVHRCLRTYMDIHDGYPWISGFTWISMVDIHGYLQTSMVIDEGYPWISLDIHGAHPWIIVNVHGYLWTSTDMHDGFP